MVRWGIIGCGDVAEYKSGPPLYRTPCSELIAVARRDGTKAADFARRHGARRFYTDAKDLVADPEIDAVYIASPHALHLEHASLAARAGKIILCEKPMGTSTAEAQTIVDICKQHGVPLTVAYYRRFWPITRVIHRLLGEGVIGRLLQVRVQLADYFNLDPSRPWLTSYAASGGGALVNAGSHWIDLIHFLIGQVTEVDAYSLHTRGWEIEDTVSALLQTSDRIPIQLNITLQSPVNVQEIELVGTEGRIRAGPYGEGLWTVHRRDRQPETVQFQHSGPAHSEMISELVSRLLEGQPSPLPGEEAVDAWRVMEAIYQSARESRRVSVGKGIN